MGKGLLLIKKTSVQKKRRHKKSPNSSPMSILLSTAKTTKWCIPAKLILRSRRLMIFRLIWHDICKIVFLPLIKSYEKKFWLQQAKKMMECPGFCMYSVRFICGTQDIHKELEASISDYFKTEDIILYASCFDANRGMFDPCLSTSKKCCCC